MTIANAMKEFFLKLNGIKPGGGNIADVIRNGAADYQSAKGAILIKSSTAESTKTFGITVDDSGTVTATEIT